MSGLPPPGVRPPLRRYRGFLADSARWSGFAWRPDDIVITTPSKCGTTWTQTIVAMLVLGRVDLGAPLSELSPWLDMKVRSTDEVFAHLAAQTHRRFIKTHTPLDGLPRVDGVTYLAVVRHPLDVALADRDHRRNLRLDRMADLVARTEGTAVAPGSLGEPEDPAAYLRWFVDNDLPATGSGPNGLADFCEQVRTYWSARHDPGVHLFHYADLCRDRGGEMRRMAGALGVPVDEDRWAALVGAAGFDAMRARADLLAPDASLGLWREPRRFFRQGGTRDWAQLLDEADLAHFSQRLHELAGDAAAWILDGRAALDGR